MPVRLLALQLSLNWVSSLYAHINGCGRLSRSRSKGPIHLSKNANRIARFAFRFAREQAEPDSFFVFALRFAQTARKPDCARKHPLRARLLGLRSGLLLLRASSPANRAQAEQTKSAIHQGPLFEANRPFAHLVCAFAFFEK